MTWLPIRSSENHRILQIIRQQQRALERNNLLRTVSSGGDHCRPQSQIDKAHPLHPPPSHLWPFLATELERGFPHRTR